MNRREFCQRSGMFAIATPAVATSFDKSKSYTRRELIALTDYPDTLCAYFWHMETGDDQQECVWESYAFECERGDLPAWRESLRPLDNYQIHQLESILAYWVWTYSEQQPPPGYSEDHHQRLPDCFNHLADDWLVKTLAGAITLAEFRQFCIDLVGADDYQEEGGDREFYHRYKGHAFRKDGSVPKVAALKLEDIDLLEYCHRHLPQSIVPLEHDPHDVIEALQELTTNSPVGRRSVRMLHLADKQESELRSALCGDELELAVQRAWNDAFRVVGIWYYG